jgi:hypothetical protein
VLRRIGAALLVLLGLFFAVRAVAELVLVDPGRPGTYRDDWGAPSYLGVVLVHAGPGLVALALAALWWLRRRGRTAAPSPAPEDVDERAGGAGQNEDDDERRP